MIKIKVNLFNFRNKKIYLGHFKINLNMAKLIKPVKVSLQKHPEITEKVVDALVASSRQTIVTTHSPIVLNYLEEEVARQSVTLLYKRPDGRTQACRFFDIPSAAEKLNCLAAGDAMLDLSLNDIAIEAEQIRIGNHV